MIKNVYSGEYKSVRTKVDSITFASKRKASRYRILKLLSEKGHIQNLELQPKFKIEVQGEHICYYIADFKYTEKGKVIIENVLEVERGDYELKKKLMRVVFGIELLEI